MEIRSRREEVTTGITVELSAQEVVALKDKAEALDYSRRDKLSDKSIVNRDHLEDLLGFISHLTDNAVATKDIEEHLFRRDRVEVGKIPLEKNMP